MLRSMIVTERERFGYRPLLLFSPCRRKQQHGPCPYIQAKHKKTSLDDCILWDAILRYNVMDSAGSSSLTLVILEWGIFPLYRLPRFSIYLARYTLMGGL